MCREVSQFMAFHPDPKHIGPNYNIMQTVCLCVCNSHTKGGAHSAAPVEYVCNESPDPIIGECFNGLYNHCCIVRAPPSIPSHHHHQLLLCQGKGFSMSRSTFQRLGQIFLKRSPLKSTGNGLRL